MLLDGRDVVSLTVAQHGRPTGAGRFALPLRRGQRGTAVRPGGRGRQPTGRSRRHQRSLRAGHHDGGRARRLRRRARHRRVPGVCTRERPEPRPAARYAALYGPTAGDRIRLADTDLLIEITDDLSRRAGPRRRRGRLRRRQGHPRVDGPVAAHRGTGRAGPGHHRCGRAGPLGDRQGRRRHQGRSDRGARQGRQPRHDGRRAPRPGDRTVDRGAGRQRQDPHRRCHRLPRPPHLPAGARHRARDRDHDGHRRRDRTGRGHQGHDGHRGTLLPVVDAHARWTAGPSTWCCSARATPSRPTPCGNSCGPAPAASSSTRTGVPRPPPSTPACGCATRPGSRRRCTPTR